MSSVLLGVTGSVAAIKTPELFARLKAEGHHVHVVATTPATSFFDPAKLAPAPQEGSVGRRDADIVTLDEDEWPVGRLWQRDEPVLHIDLRRWAEIFVIAPLDANTLAKLAGGLCDNALTCVWRAWDTTRPIALAPAMNTHMWEHPATRRHLAQVASDAGLVVPPGSSSEAVMALVNGTSPRLRILPPVSRRLACGDEGVGAMAAVADIVGVVNALGQPGLSP